MLVEMKEVIAFLDYLSANSQDLVDCCGFTQLEITVIWELVERWIRVDPHPHFSPHCQKTTVGLNMHFPHFVEDLLITQEKHLKDVQHFFQR